MGLAPYRGRRDILYYPADSLDGVAVRRKLMGALTRQQLMSKLSKLLNQLASHGIHDTSDYAEVLVAEALKAERVQNSINQGFDLISSEYGRVEVK
jgi:hypothetical protein